MTRVTRFLELQLHTHLHTELAGFYRDTLGLPVQQGTDHSFLVSIGASVIQFLPATHGEPSYHIAFNIPENKVEPALAWLHPRAQLIPHFKSGALIIDWPFWHAHSVYFLDPGGNILEVIARHELQNAAGGNFTASDLLGISEIGLVVPDPHSTIALLSRTFGLPTKSLLDDFGAVGDDRGLFIVSAENRPWMPTDNLRAERFPARVRVEHERKVHLELPGTDYIIESA